MRRFSGGMQAVVAVGLTALTVLGVVLTLVGRGRARAGEATEGRHSEEPGVAEARALVAVLEARVRATEANLHQARQLLAQLGGTAQTDSKTTAVNDQKPAVVDHRLEGVWRIVSVGGNLGGNFRKPPYDEYKIMSAGRYLWLSFEPETGKVLRSGGGAYTLDGESYTARVEFSNSVDLSAITGQEYQGTCKIDGKKWYHSGHMPNGAVFDELWERVH